MASRKRQKAERRGRLAETVAAFWLRTKGYSILATRLKLPVGEVDIIARRGDTLAFIEVKQRKTLELAQTAVSIRSWQRISRAGETWARRRRNLETLNWRYDLVAITPWTLPKHFRDYWRP